MDVTHFALTLLVGRPNDEKSALTCVQIDLDQSEHKSSQVSSSARKAWPNGVAQVFNLRLLATPFGQGFRFEILGADQNGRASGEENEESGECDGVCAKLNGKKKILDCKPITPRLMLCVTQWTPEWIIIISLVRHNTAVQRRYLCPLYVFFKLKALVTKIATKCR